MVRHFLSNIGIIFLIITIIPTSNSLVNISMQKIPIKTTTIMSNASFVNNSNFVNNNQINEQNPTGQIPLNSLNNGNSTLSEIFHKTTDGMTIREEGNNNKNPVYLGRELAITWLINKINIDKNNILNDSGEKTEIIIDENQATTDYSYYSFLPLIQKQIQANGIITFNGIPLPGTSVNLVFYDGVTWSIIDTAITEESGIYRFNELPNLLPGQYFYVEWNNPTDDPNYLSHYFCNPVDDLSHQDFLECSFDVKDVILVSPPNGSIIKLPASFSWVPRGIDNDDYEFNIFTAESMIPWWRTNPSLGYVENFTLNSLPQDFFPGVEYGWALGVYTPSGYGTSYYYRKFTVYGASGRVTFNSEGIAGTPVDLYYFNGYSWSKNQTTYTDANGVYVFPSIPDISGEEKFQVIWINPNQDTSQLSLFSCYIVEPTTNPFYYHCNFDVKDIVILSPEPGTRSTLPTTFTWQGRGFLDDSYLFVLMDYIDSDPTWTSSALGNVSTYSLTTLASPFNYWTTYGWFAGAQTPHGFAQPFYGNIITFTTFYCEPSYPTVCIPPPPPDLDCSDITYRNFSVLPPDPHYFDYDMDGIGCETY